MSLNHYCSRNTFVFIFIVIINTIIFGPIMGRGFIQDDFLHIQSVYYASLSSGLLQAHGGLFYTPTAWLSYLLDWYLWGWNPFAFAVINLLIHSANIFLLFSLARILWRSTITGIWIAVGYGLFMVSNVPAIMHINSRAHLITAFFYLLTMLSTVWFMRNERFRYISFLTIITFTFCTMFSKENGWAAAIAVVLIIIHEKFTLNVRNVSTKAIALLFAVLLVVIAFYFILRSQSGATKVSFGCDWHYKYCLSMKIIFENIIRYGLRTFGALGILGIAIYMFRRFQGYKPDLSFITRYDLLLTLTLSGCTLGPVLLIASRSIIYTYVPGIFAALLLGAVVNSFYKQSQKFSSGNFNLSILPLFIAITFHIGYIISHSMINYKKAKTSTLVLNQMTDLVKKPKPNTFIVLRYAEKDGDQAFTQSIFWGFGAAVQVLYSDPTLGGEILQDGTSCSQCMQANVIKLRYVKDNSGGKIIREL